MRLGQGVVFPIISMINFIIISYSLTSVGDVMPLEYYIPIVVSVLVLSLVAIGNMFRHRQMGTDHTMVYENNPEMVKTLLALLSQEKDAVDERITYHKSVLKKHED